MLLAIEIVYQYHFCYSCSMNDQDKTRTNFPVSFDETEEDLLRKISASFSKILSLEKKMADRKGEEK